MSDRPSHKPKKLKQTNKPFKPRGKSQPKKRSLGRTAHQASSDCSSHSKQSRLNMRQQQRRSQRQQLLDKRRNLGSDSFMNLDDIPLVPLLVGFLPLNEQSDVSSLKLSLETVCEQSSENVFTLPKWADRNTQVQFIPIPREEFQVLDWCKVIDILVVSTSCISADLSHIKSNPEKSNVIDDLGYSLISAVKTQGLPAVIGYISDIFEVHAKQKEVKKLYSRYLASEFPETKIVVDDPEKLLRNIGSCISNLSEAEWRSMRSYILPSSLEVANSCLEIEGFLRGSGLLNNSSLVHITGYGDFALSGLDIGSGMLECEGEINPENDPGAFAAEQTWPTEEELATAFSKLDVVPSDHLPNALIDDNEDEGDFLELDESQKLELVPRDRGDMDFPDEVDTPNDMLCKERFQRYRGLASFRTSPWDPYENLPREYSRLYEYKEPCHVVKKISTQQMQSLTHKGMYVKAQVKDFPCDILQTPIVVSSILPLEHKLSVMHFKLERWGDVTSPIKSKQRVCFNVGFKRFWCNPIYSEDGANSDKFHYLKEFKDMGTVVASVYAPISFPPSNVLVYNEEGALVAVGKNMGFDTKRMIIKRILLTGYPIKSHKRKAVVRYMFLDPKDIKYFKPVELFTKHGLRGHIVDSVGTHGNMKCVFNDFIKHDDIVCMPLYKRVYPVWDESLWRR